jgi:hypothetical protein
MRIRLDLMRELSPTAGTAAFTTSDFEAMLGSWPGPPPDVAATASAAESEDRRGKETGDD